MVNLFEPFLLSLLRKHQVLQASSKTEDILVEKVKVPEIKIFQKIASATARGSAEEVPLKNVGIKESFFSPQRTERWLGILSETKSVASEEIKPHWNFLFPEIPLFEERIFWQDEKAKSQCFATMGKKEDTFCLCLLFESLRTGKVWIYLEYSTRAETSCSLFFQTEKESMKRKIEQDKTLLAKELKNLGNIRISVETNNDNLVKMTQNQLGILV